MHGKDWFSASKWLHVNGDALINGLTVGLGNGGTSSNTVLGDGAFSSNAGGTANVAIGFGSLTNNLTGGTGNATNSAIISSANSNITPVGAGNRIVVIGCNGVTATKNNTTYVDGIDTQGSHTYRSITHVTTNTYNLYTFLDDKNFLYANADDEKYYYKEGTILILSNAANETIKTIDM